MMNRESLAAVLAAISLAVAACSKPAPPPAAGPPQVVITPVIQQDEPIYQEWIGTTEGDVNAEIRPKIEGYLLRRNYTEGSLVEEGQLLFEIDPRQFQAQLNQAQANLEEAKAGLTKAEHDVARFEPLAAQKAMSQQELDNARSAEQAAKATAGSLQAQVDQARLNMSWAQVTSPITGIAGIAQQQVGDLVSPQTVLATVSKCDPIRVIYQMSEQEYLDLQRDPVKKNQPLALILTDGSIFPQKGHVLLSGRAVDVKTGTITTIGTFPNPGNLLRPGQYAKVRAVTRIESGAILVPQRAVNEMQGIYQVAVVGSDNKAAIRAVDVGPRVGSDWIIEKGLAPGDHVVVEGFSRVKSGATVIPSEAPPPAATDSSSSTAAPRTR